MSKPSILQTLGVHPLLGIALIAIDSMLFAGEAATAGVSLVISCAAGVVLMIASILIQKAAYGDSWMAATGKGIVLGLLTAIPTPLPSLVTGLMSITGGLKLLTGSPEPESPEKE